jgi:hypothetical protein
VRHKNNVAMELLTTLNKIDTFKCELDGTIKTGVGDNRSNNDEELVVL